MKGVDDAVQHVRGDVQDVGKKVEGVDNRVESVGEMMRAVDDRVQGVDNKLDQANRASFTQLTTLHSEASNIFTGNHIRDNLLRWLSPPDPSTNHNHASKIHHHGTSRWFFQGSIFREWKSTGSFLWIHGKRAFFSLFTTRQLMVISRSRSGLRKEHTLVRPSSIQIAFQIYMVDSVLRLYKTSYPCKTPGWPRWPTFISTLGMLTSKNCKTCSLPYLSSSPLALIPVVTSSPNSILHTIVVFGNPVNVL